MKSEVTGIEYEKNGLCIRTLRNLQKKISDNLLVICPKTTATLWNNRNDIFVTYSLRV